MAGRPSQPDLVAFGGFAAWSDLIRSAVVWLGMPDPLAPSREARHEPDPELEAYLVALRAIRAVYQDDPFQARGLVAHAEAESDELRAALEGLAPGKKGTELSKALGYVFRKRVNQVHGRLRLRRVKPGGGKSKDSVFWTVEDLEGPEGFPESGPSIQDSREDVLQGDGGDAGDGPAPTQSALRDSFQAVTISLDHPIPPGAAPRRSRDSPPPILLNKIVEVPPLKRLIQQSPGFHKKELAHYKLDILALCGFGCRYCSSNWGNYLRINQEKFLQHTREQTGLELLPSDDPSLMFRWPDVVQQLDRELAHARPNFGEGKVLVFSMLTDGFSPWLVEQGITRAVLDLVLACTRFRVRVLTKSSVVGSPEWVAYFASHRDRFVVGISTGSLDEKWTRQIELGTPSPSARFQALHALQDAGVPTYGMLCPVFPDVLEGDGVERLVEQVRPDRVEHVWAEAYNDRANWKVVQSGYAPTSAGHAWFSDVYGRRNKAAWSRYATDLYLRLRTQAEQRGWLGRLRYLLYEDQITAEDAHRLGDLSGVLLQSKPRPDGRSTNPYVAALQRG